MTFTPLQKIEIFPCPIQETISALNQFFGTGFDWSYFKTLLLGQRQLNYQVYAETSKEPVFWGQFPDDTEKPFLGLREWNTNMPVGWQLLPKELRAKSIGLYFCKKHKVAERILFNFDLKASKPEFESQSFKKTLESLRPIMNRKIWFLCPLR